MGLIYEKCWLLEDSFNRGVAVFRILARAARDPPRHHPCTHAHKQKLPESPCFLRDGNRTQTPTKTILELGVIWKSHPDCCQASSGDDGEVRSSEYRIDGFTDWSRA